MNDFKLKLILVSDYRTFFQLASMSQKCLLANCIWDVIWLLLTVTFFMQIFYKVVTSGTAKEQLINDTFLNPLWFKCGKTPRVNTFIGTAYHTLIRLVMCLKKETRWLQFSLQVKKKTENTVNWILKTNYEWQHIFVGKYK